jgi:peptidoglycan/xylan/chitin deacetylase (PgdA/CDA1 family)
VFSHLRAANLSEHVAAGNVVVRIDDIQDYYFHDAQIQLLQHSVSRGYPLSLGIIAKEFGLDAELVEAVRVAVHAGSEVATHGWIHEDLAQLSASEQVVQFERAKNRLWNTLEVNPLVLIPPMYSYSNDTLLAMKQVGYKIVSGYIGMNKDGITFQGIVSVPATVELSELSGANWTMKSVNAVMAEINSSIESNGYAVIVTHPEEFLQNSTFSGTAFGRYCEILDRINSHFTMTTLEGLRQEVLLRNPVASSPEGFGLVTSAFSANHPLQPDQMFDAGIDYLSSSLNVLQNLSSR